VATTSAHGAKGADKSDWTPLAGKEVVLLPDNDAPGEDYARAVIGVLARLGPRPRVRIVRLPGLPEGGDIVEWNESLRDSWGPDEARAELERLADAAPLENLDAHPPAAAGPADGPAKTSGALRWLPTPVGSWLTCDDRHDQPANIGRVLRDMGDRALMRFREGEPFQRDVEIAKADMTFQDGESLSDEGGGVTVQQGEEWPPLRLGELPPSPPFPVDVFPLPLQTYCHEAAATIQAPAEFVGVVMLAVAGAAIGQTVNLSLTRTWFEPTLLTWSSWRGPARRKPRSSEWCHAP
jgi:hypothetical protein